MKDIITRRFALLWGWETMAVCQHMKIQQRRIRLGSPWSDMRFWYGQARVVIEPSEAETP